MHVQAQLLQWRLWIQGDVLCGHGAGTLGRFLHFHIIGLGDCELWLIDRRARWARSIAIHGAADGGVLTLGNALLVAAHGAILALHGVL